MRFDISKHGKGRDTFRRERRYLIQMAWNCRRRMLDNPDYSLIDVVQLAKKSHLAQIKDLNRLIKERPITVRFIGEVEFQSRKPQLFMIKHVSDWKFWNGKAFVDFKGGYFYSEDSVKLPDDGVWFDLVSDWKSEKIGFWRRLWNGIKSYSAFLTRQNYGINIKRL